MCLCMSERVTAEMKKKSIYPRNIKELLKNELQAPSGSYSLDKSGAICIINIMIAHTHLLYDIHASVKRSRDCVG
jgi:hypothetical protein